MSEKRQLELVVAPPVETRPTAWPESPPPQAPAVREPEAPLRMEPGDFGARVRQLLGRAPTGPELAEFVRVRDALGLRDNDALWLVLLALQHQRREIERAIDVRLADARETADAILETARARFLEQFPAALTQTAAKTAVKAMGATGPVRTIGLLAGLALLMVGIGGVGWLAYGLGERAGYEKGLSAQGAGAPPGLKSPAAAQRR